MAFLVPPDPLTPQHRYALALPRGTRIVRRQALGVFQQAQDVLQVAQTQAGQMRASARQVYEDERRRGHAEGLAEALRESSRQLAAQALRVDEHLAGMEQPLVDVVMAAMRRLVQDYSEAERVQHAVRNALTVVRNRQHITLRVPPLHVGAVREQTATLRSEYPGVALFEVVADDQVPKDGCVLSCDLGTVTSSIEAQMEALEAAVQEVCTAQRPDGEPAAKALKGLHESSHQQQQQQQQPQPDLHLHLHRPAHAQPEQTA